MESEKWLENFCIRGNVFKYKRIYKNDKISGQK